MERRSPEGVLLNENAYKRFVRVLADHKLDGKTFPLRFCTEDGPTIRIDSIKDVHQAAATKAGGQGTRYTCMVGGQEIYLFHDRDMWFVEFDREGGDQLVRALSYDDR